MDFEKLFKLHDRKSKQKPRQKPPNTDEKVIGRGKVKPSPKPTGSPPFSLSPPEQGCSQFMAEDDPWSMVLRAEKNMKAKTNVRKSVDNNSMIEKPHQNALSQLH